MPRTAFSNSNSLFFLLDATIVSIFIIVFITIAVVRVVTHVRKGRVNDLLEVRLNLLGTAKDEGFEAREAALTKLVGEGDGGLIFLLLIGVVHILIVIIDIVTGDGIVGLAESKEDRDDSVNLLLAKTMSNGTRHSAHSPDETACVGNLEVGIGGGILLAGCPGLALSTLANALGKLNLGKETFHETDKEGIGNHGGKGSDGGPGAFPHNVAVGC
jgi:hypothetical protein